MFSYILFLFLIALTAAGVVQCGGHKTYLRTSTIVQFMVLFLDLREQHEYSEKSEINDWFRLIFMTGF